MIGVYKLTSASGKFYIGSSCDIRRRLKDHASAFRRGTHSNSHLQRAFRKYGAFNEEVLLICRTEDLIMYEQLCIDCLNPSYNQSRIAGRIEPTPEVRAKISAARTGKRRKAVAKRGPCTAETRIKIGAAHKGKIVNNETRAKLSCAATGKKRAPFTDATRAKMSAARKNRVITSETCARLSEARKRWWAKRRDLQSVSDCAINDARQTGDA